MTFFIPEAGRGITMFIRKLSETPFTRVMDQSILAELLHPDKEPLAGDLGCSVAFAIVPQKEATLPHRLNTTTELYFILEGQGEMHIEDEKETVEPGNIVLIPAGSRQWIVNTGPRDLTFICIVSPRWKETDEELVKG